MQATQKPATLRRQNKPGDAGFHPVMKTIKDIAKDLGLNHSTVGYALSGKGTVSEATRKKVLSYAAKVGYRPNLLAQRMRSRRTNILGLVIPDVMFMYSEVVQNLFREVRAAGLELQIGLSEFNGDLEGASIQMMLDSRADGLIIKSNFPHLSDVPAAHPLRKVLDYGLPAVFYGEHPKTDRPTVLEPAFDAGLVLTRHLLDRGHKRIAYLVPMSAPLVSIAVRGANGARSALAERGLPASSLVELCIPKSQFEVGAYMDQFRPAAAITYGRDLFLRAIGPEGSADGKVTAMICYNDSIAIGALHQAQSMGLQIPGDVAVASLLQSPWVHCSPIPLTSVDWRPNGFAKLLLNSLLQQIDPPPSAREDAVAGADLIVRGST